LIKLRQMLVAALAAIIAAGTPVLADLKVGDPAPPLKIKDWMRGEAVNLAKEAAKKIHMVEFWATWCPPCKASVPLLTQYQKKYEKDLVIIGVTDPDPSRNSPTEIKQFVKEQGKNMMYTVAIDDNGATSKAYLPSEMVGIPYAFLVGRDGRVVWEGSPLDPALEQVIPDVINGKYDVAAAKAAANLDQEVAKRFQSLEMAYQMGETDTVWKGVIEILKLDPSNETAMQLLTGLYASEPKKAEEFKTWARGHIAKYKSDAKAMHRLAVTLCGNEDFASRTPDLALEAAKAAYEASKQTWAIEVYAKALYQIGNLDRAIALQQEAVSAAPDGDRPAAQGVLDYYQLCKKLQSSTN